MTILEVTISTLPRPNPQDYPSLSDESLQFEVSFCTHAIDLIDKNGYKATEEIIKNIRAMYEDRLRLAIDELERRYLLS